MSNTIILIIVAVAVVVLLIGVFTTISILNHRKAKKIQENLKKLKQEDKNQELEEKNIKLVAEQKGENVSEEEIFGGVGQTSGGGFFTGGNKKDDDIGNMDFDEEFYQPKEDDVPRMPNRPDYRNEDLARQDREDDFEKFLDEHAFSRKVFDKSLLDKIKKLPPEIKSIIMGNVFDKFNDDDDK